MVSVVIPTYNRSKLVLEAVQSVCAQQGVPFEVIVVDDGSTDGTARELEAFGEPVRYIAQVHRGVAAARNRGIAEARGEWIGFLDSDDLWLPGKLAAQMGYLASNPDIRICQTEEIWLRDGKHVNPKRYHQKPEGFCFGSLLDRCMVSPSAVVIHRSVFGVAGLFDESLPACEDYDLWLRIGCRYPLGLIREPLVVKRGGHPDQLSATVPALDRYRIAALTKLLEKDPLTAEQRQLALEALKRKSAVYAQGCRRRGRTEEAESVEHQVRALCGSTLATTAREVSPVDDV
jgi:glycosyltransferase involved in cell wall biosynthesis